MWKLFETVKVKVVLTVQNNISFSNVRVMFPVSRLNNKLKKQGYLLQIKKLLYKRITLNYCQYSWTVGDLSLHVLIVQIHYRNCLKSFLALTFCDKLPLSTQNKVYSPWKGAQLLCLSNKTIYLQWSFTKRLFICIICAKKDMSLD